MLASLLLTFFVTGAEPPAKPSEKQAEATTKAPAPSASALTPVSDKEWADKVIAPHKGKVLLVNFWASYCLPCLEEIPALQELAKEQAKDVDVVFVSSDPPSQAPHALALLKRRKIEITSFIVSNEDPEPFLQMIDKGWGGEMPYTVIYDAKGNAIQKMPGAHKKAEFAAALAAAVQKK